MQVIVDSLLTTYADEGKGKLVLLLHGWGDRADGFAQLRRELSKKYRVLSIDLPGFGGTQAPGTAWGLDEYAQFVAHFLQKIDAGKVYALLGHSNGGAIAVRGLARGALTADKLVLLGSAGVRSVYKGRKKALRILAKTAKAITLPLPKSVKLRLRKKAYKAIGSDMFVAEHLQETFKRVVTDDVQADAAQLALPVLLIYGEQDDQTPVWFGEALHNAIDGSTLEVMAGAGHFVHIDRPAEVTRAIQEFLR